MLTTSSNHWAEQEFAGIDLGDGRLDKRAKILMERFTSNPTASIPMACRSWGGTCAAYRFLSNPDVEWQDLMAPHWAQTQKRMSAYPVVLCSQDTTDWQHGKDACRVQAAPDGHGLKRDASKATTFDLASCAGKRLANAK